MTYLPGGTGKIKVIKTFQSVNQINIFTQTWVTLANTSHTPTTNGYIWAIGTCAGNSGANFGEVRCKIRYSSNGGANWTSSDISSLYNLGGFGTCVSQQYQFAVVAGTTYLVELQGNSDDNGSAYVYAAGANLLSMEY